MPVGTTSKLLRYSFPRKKFQNRWVYLVVLSLRLQKRRFSNVQSMITSEPKRGVTLGTCTTRTCILLLITNEFSTEGLRAYSSHCQIYFSKSSYLKNIMS